MYTDNFKKDGSTAVIDIINRNTTFYLLNVSCASMFINNKVTLLSSLKITGLTRLVRL